MVEYDLNLKKIGETIKRIRIEKEMSQETLAELSGLGRKHLSAIENGKQNMTLDTLFKLSSGLGIEAYILIK